MSTLEVNPVELVDASAQALPVEAAAEPIDPKLRVLLGIAAVLAAQSEDDDGGGVTAQVRDLASRDPLHALLATVVGGGLLYHHLEKETPGGPHSPLDGIFHVARSLAAGGSLSPSTSKGTALAAVVQALGPALAMNALNPPAARAAEREREARRNSEELLAVNRAILQRLSEIAAALPPK